jgi:hypothetical protein
VVNNGNGNSGPDDRGRARQNLIAVVVLVALVLGGIWLFTTLRRSARIEQCLEAGLRNCGPDQSP